MGHRKRTWPSPSLRASPSNASRASTSLDAFSMRVLVSAKSAERLASRSNTAHSRLAYFAAKASRVWSRSSIQGLGSNGGPARSPSGTERALAATPTNAQVRTLGRFDFSDELLPRRGKSMTNPILRRGRLLSRHQRGEPPGARGGVYPGVTVHALERTRLAEPSPHIVPSASNDHRLCRERSRRCPRAFPARPCALVGGEGSGSRLAGPLRRGAESALIVT